MLHKSDAFEDLISSLGVPLIVIAKCFCLSCVCVCVCFTFFKFVNLGRRKGSVEGKFSPWMKTCGLRNIILWWTESYENQRLLFKLDCLYFKEITKVWVSPFFFPILVIMIIWLFFLTDLLIKEHFLLLWSNSQMLLVTDWVSFPRVDLSL